MDFPDISNNVCQNTIIWKNILINSYWHIIPTHFPYLEHRNTALEFWWQNRQLTHTAHNDKYTHGSSFVVFHCDLVPVDVKRILSGSYLTDSYTESKICRSFCTSQLSIITLIIVSLLANNFNFSTAKYDFILIMPFVYKLCLVNISLGITLSCKASERFNQTYCWAFHPSKTHSMMGW